MTMKKYVVYIILAFAVMFLLPSCENGGDVDFADNTLTLTLSCNDLGLTRATVDGEDTYNENTINSIDCFFYPANADFNTDALVVKNNISTLTKTAFGTYTATIKFEEEELKTLFGTVNKGGSANALIYIIANRPANVDLPTGKPTINELKALTITSDFSKSQKQTSFVMDSDGKPDSTNDTSVAGSTNTDIDNDDLVIYTIDANGSKSLTATVPLYRTAAKITLSVNRFGPEGANNTVTVGDKTYTPNYAGVYAVLHNGVKTSVIAPDVISRTVISSDLFATDDFSMDATEAPCKLGTPFYSYAYDWSETIDNATYITLVVPWKANDENSYVPYYYKVPVNYSGDKLERNTHYKIDIAVSILGTLNPNSTVTIEPSYTILNWSNDEIPTSMSDFRYLMVEQNSYVMNNINTINIPYWTSHNCTIVSVNVTKPDLYNGGGKTITVPSSDYDLDLTTKDGNVYITYNKELDNVYTSSTFDFAPYTITFRIQHIDSTKYYEDITITQYPAIYGNYEVNVDGTSDRNNGYTFVNGYQGTNNGNYDFFGSVNGMGNTTSSPNRYIFTVTSVKGTPYIIGDPRDMDITYDGDEADWYDRGRRITNGVIASTTNNEIRYYYGTDVTSPGYDNATSTNVIYANDAAAEAAERTINMVAPKFMLASGYAVLGTGADEVEVLENLKKRCASYQEDGYPAGRWRLPTRAEFQLILTQVNKRTLPEVYIFNTTYWCAHGLGTPRNTNGVVSVEMEYVGRDGSGHSTRCVYDLWYWGEHDKMTNAADKNVFTWGDVPRSDKAYAPSINY